MNTTIRRRRTAAIEEYVTVMAAVVAEARELAACGDHPVDAVPDEDLLHGLLRLREAVVAARRGPARIVRSAG
jgi:hypothetical protein